MTHSVASSRRSGLRALLLAASLLAPFGLPASADELRIAMKGAVDGADPHLSYTPNRNVQEHVYDSLLRQNAHLRPEASLAESWREVDPLTWEFTLRPGVKFSDGSPLTPADVIFSMRRAQAMTGVRTFAANMRNVVSLEATGPRTLLMHMSQPTPLQPAYMTAVAIVSATAAKDATTADWNGGKAAIGSGPYRWIKWTAAQDVVLERNDGYWGPKEPWDKVTFRFIPNDSARVAALLAGDVDVIDTLPPELYGRLKASDKVKLLTSDSAFLNYINLDSISQTIVNATDADGKQLPQNPLKDLRVREAIDHALNRKALAETVMQGGAAAAGQPATDGFNGNVPGLEPAKYDPALSKQLLAEAGYPKGFTLAVACTNDRFAGDANSCQAVGHMLDAVGIHVKLDALPSTVFFRRAATLMPNGSPDLSFEMHMFAFNNGITLEGMNSVLHSPVAASGLGSQNRNVYSDPQLDALLEKASATFDDSLREKQTQDAVRYAMEHRAIVPLFYVKASWGLRNDLTLEPRGDQYTLATTIRKINN